jgi:transcriptional/translational regulatory protein YebC/TACO1
MAAKQGGFDIAKNVELARALKVAKEEKLPKENIDRLLKKVRVNLLRVTLIQ